MVPMKRPSEQKHSVGVFRYLVAKSPGGATALNALSWKCLLLKYMSFSRRLVSIDLILTLKSILASSLFPVHSLINTSILFFDSSGLNNHNCRNTQGDIS